MDNKKGSYEPTIKEFIRLHRLENNKSAKCKQESAPCGFNYYEVFFFFFFHKTSLKAEFKQVVTR